MSEWNSDKIEQFFASTEYNPARYQKLLNTDPVGRLVRDRRALVVELNGLSRQAHEAVLDPARRDQLRQRASVVDGRLQKIREALTAIAVIFTQAEVGEPTVLALKERIEHLQRHCRPAYKGSGDHSAVDGEISQLDAVVKQVEHISAGAL